MKLKSTLAIGVILLLLATCGIRELIYEVKNAYTSEYSQTYSRAIGQMMGLQFDSLALRGEGVRIGVIDAGFGGFRSNRFTRNLKVADYRDLTDNDTTGFFQDDIDHGMRVTQNIGGYSNDTLRGLACQATYYLIKADLAETEPREDEHRLCRAVEWLAQQGVDAINISLAYTTFDDFDDYTPAMLDGHTALCSRVIDSILNVYPNLVIVQSAGNEGNEKWKYIGFPGDVREVITVGSVNFDATARAPKSGKGYYPDRIKPDFVVFDSPPGTSFSAPIVTSLCAVIIGYEPMGRRKLIELLHASATRNTTPDMEMGYGTPQCDTLLQLIHEQRNRR